MSASTTAITIASAIATTGASPHNGMISGDLTFHHGRTLGRSVAVSLYEPDAPAFDNYKPLAE